MLTEKLLKSFLANKFFENVPKEAIANINSNFFQQFDYNADDLIVKENTDPDQMFLIISGDVKVVKSVPGGKKIVLFERHINEFIGEFALVGNRKRSASVYAINSVKLVAIDKKNFFKILENFPQIKDNIAKAITGKMVESDDKTTFEIERNSELLRLNQQINNQKEELENLNKQLQDKNKELQKANEKLTESETNLKHANATKDKFFSIIAHDLKNPLSVTIGFSDMLKDYYENMAEQDKIDAIKGINQSSKKLLKLLENLLDWSRVQTGRIQYKPEQIDVKLLVMGSMHLMMMNALSKKIIIEINVPDGIFVYADMNMASTIIRNLLGNAIKFTPQERTITVSAKDTGENFIEISVIDSGVGIPEEDIDKLFRIDVTHTTYGTSKEKGTGLGLILCKEFVEKNGGKIWVQSQKDKGSTFTFSLPQKKPN